MQTAADIDRLGNTALAIKAERDEALSELKAARVLADARFRDLEAAREAFLNLIAEARRWDEDTDGEYDEGGARTWTFYFAEFKEGEVRELVEALGIPVAYDELAGDAIARRLKADEGRQPLTVGAV